MIDEHLVQRSELDAIREAAANTPQRDSFADDPRVREPFGDDRDAEVVRFVKDRGRWLAEVLDGLDGFVARHVHFESEAQRTAVVLWVAVTYVADAFDVAPYLHIKSPEKQSGKTLLLEVLELTAWDALMTSNISPAALFRLMDSRRPTLLFDEIDSVFPSRKGNQRRRLGRSCGPSSTPGTGAERRRYGSAARAGTSSRSSTRSAPRPWPVSVSYPTPLRIEPFRSVCSGSRVR